MRIADVRRLPVALAAAAVLTTGAAGSAAAATSAPSAGAVSYDISFPQCGGSFPGGALPFGVVGVNDGRPDTANPCLPGSSGELAWDLGTSYPELYLNTADPGNSYHHKLIADWPTSSVAADPNPCTATVVGHGPNATTVGENSIGCAWQYGYDVAQNAQADVSSALTAFSLANPGAYPYWLDVETANTWQSGSYGLQMNVADLQGMVYYLQHPTTAAATPTTVGVYSTSEAWGQITGAPSSSALGSLAGVPDWIPGASDLSTAQTTYCALPSFTYGSVAMAQWTTTIDNDVTC